LPRTDRSIAAAQTRRAKVERAMLPAKVLR
jgi:hypothetical protein